jgi:hypothetical protein
MDVDPSPGLTGEPRANTSRRELRDGEQDGYLLIDPSWQPASAGAVPPVEAVVGLWPLKADGSTGKFRSNPDYWPGDDSPSDPLDAALRLMLRGEASVAELRTMVRDTLFDLAVNDDGRPYETFSPDGVRCVVVASGLPHRSRVRTPGWRRIDLEELVLVLADGVDVLINPAGPASLRLTGDFMRESVLMDDGDLAVE